MSLKQDRICSELDLGNRIFLSMKQQVSTEIL